MYLDNDILSTRQNKNLLFDFYGALLTQKQRDVFTMSTMDDCSFAEIGQEMDITPQAVADIFKRAAAQLDKYEQSLGLVEKLLSQRQSVEEIESVLNKLDSFGKAGKIGKTEISEWVCTIRTSLDKMLL